MGGGGRTEIGREQKTVISVSFSFQSGSDYFESVDPTIWWMSRTVLGKNKLIGIMIFVIGW